MVKENKFAQRIKELRKEKHWSQEFLASQIGYSKSAIGEWEKRHKEPNFDTLIKLANLFDISIDYLLGRVDY